MGKKAPRFSTVSSKTFAASGLESAEPNPAPLLSVLNLHWLPSKRRRPETSSPFPAPSALTSDSHNTSQADTASGPVAACSTCWANGPGPERLLREVSWSPFPHPLPLCHLMKGQSHCPHTFSYQKIIPPCCHNERQTCSKLDFCYCMAEERRLCCPLRLNVAERGRRESGKSAGKASDVGCILLRGKHI